MRMLMQVKFPLEPFNTAVRNGEAAAIMKRILDDLKPEAAYFMAQNGHRGGVLIVNLDSASDIPRIAEPWFLLLNAEVQIHPVMTPADLAAADLGALGKKWA